MRALSPALSSPRATRDIIKTYVRMGMGAGVIAAMAFECQDQEDLVAIDAKGLFPKVTTWLGFPRDMVLRSYMVDFIHLLAPHYSPPIDSGYRWTPEPRGSLSVNWRYCVAGARGLRNRGRCSGLNEAWIQRSARLISWIPHSRCRPKNRVCSTVLTSCIGRVLC